MMFENEAKTGLVIGNSTMSAAVTGRGRLYGRIRYNAPYFEYGANSIREAGGSGFAFECGGVSVRDCDLKWQVSDSTYPRYMADSVLPDGTVKMSPSCARH